MSKYCSVGGPLRAEMAGYIYIDDSDRCNLRFIPMYRLGMGYLRSVWFQLENAHFVQGLVSSTPAVWILLFSLAARHQIGSTITQLRTGHSHFGSYLHTMKFRETDRCTCPHGPRESPQRFLFHCPRYSKDRLAAAKLSPYIPKPSFIPTSYMRLSRA